MTTSDYTGRDVTGGYIVKADKTNGDPIAWTMPTNNGSLTNFIYDKPNPIEITGQQGGYIRNQFQLLADATASNNSSIQNGFPSVIDIPTLIRKKLIAVCCASVIYHFIKDYYTTLQLTPISWDFGSIRI